MLKLDGRKFYKIRMEKNFSREELAKKIGVREQSIHKWENGINQPRMKRIEDLCLVLNVKPQELFFYEDSEIEKNIKVKNNHGIIGNGSISNNNSSCNEKLDKIILEICDIDDAKFTKSEMIKILLTHKKKEN